MHMEMVDVYCLHPDLLLLLLRTVLRLLLPTLLPTLPTLLGKLPRLVPQELLQLQGKRSICW